MYASRIRCLRISKFRLQKRNNHDTLAPPSTLTPDMSTNPEFSVKQQFPIPEFDKKDLTVIASELSKYPSLPAPHYEKPVLSISEVKNILEDLGARDISVIRVDPNKGYVDYFVSCIGLTRKHLTRIGQRIITEYKQKWDSKKDFVPVAEGLRTKSDWVCVNTGNCAIHLMTEFSRNNLNLEELQALGQFDPYQEIPDDIIDAQAKADDRYFQKASHDEDDMMDDLAKEFLAEDAREKYVKSAATQSGGNSQILDDIEDDHLFKDLQNSQDLMKSLTNENEQEDLAAFEDFLREQELEAEKFLGGDKNFKM